MSIKYIGTAADRAKLAAAQERYEAAKADLGSDLGGFSLVDLLADNFPWPLTECQNIARILLADAQS